MLNHEKKILSFNSIYNHHFYYEYLFLNLSRVYIYSSASRRKCNVSSICEKALSDFIAGDHDGTGWSHFEDPWYDTYHHHDNNETYRPLFLSFNLPRKKPRYPCVVAIIWINRPIRASWAQLTCLCVLITSKGCVKTAAVC